MAAGSAPVQLRALQGRVPPSAGYTPRESPLASTQPWFTGPASPAPHARPRSVEASSEAPQSERPASGTRSWGPVA
jgi:hypothetical protein